MGGPRNVTASEAGQRKRRMEMMRGRRRRRRKMRRAQRGGRSLKAFIPELSRRLSNHSSALRRQGLAAANQQTRSSRGPIRGLGSRRQPSGS